MRGHLLFHGLPSQIGLARLRGGWMSKEQILDEFRLFHLGSDGIGGWLGPGTDGRVFDRLDGVDKDHLAKVQLNQLLAFGHEAPVSDDFFRYYWLSAPNLHPYD